MSSSKPPANGSAARSHLPSAAGRSVNAAGFASQLPQLQSHASPAAASAATQHTRPLSVAWPDTHPDALTPSHAERRADLLSEFNLPASAPPHSAGHSKHNSGHSDASTHTLQPLRSVMPAGASGSSALVPSPAAHSATHSASSSPGMSAGQHSSGLQALHSSTSHLLSTFGVQSSTATGGELTPAKKKLNQFILDLVKNQIKITDDFSSMCRQKLREKDAQLHSLQLQLHDMTIEKDALASEFMQLRTQMTSLKTTNEFTLKENQKLHMQVSRADGIMAHSASTAGAGTASSTPGDLSSLKQSYETQLDHALLRQQSHYDSILLQMKSYLAEQEAQVASLKERIAVVQGERDDAKAALARAEESMRSRMAEAERRVEEAQRERSQARSEANNAIQARDEAKSETQRALLRAEKRARDADNGGEGGCCRTFLCGSFWAVILTILAVLTIASTLDATGIAPILCAKFVMGNSTNSAMQMQHAAVKCEACPAPIACAACPDPTVCPAQVECASPVDCPAATECPAAHECPFCPAPIECAACPAAVDCPAPVECPASAVCPEVAECPHPALCEPSPCLDVQSALYRELLDRGLFDFDAASDAEEPLDSTGQPLSREALQVAFILRALNATDIELRSSKQELTAARANLSTLRDQCDRSQLQSDGLTAQVLELKDQVAAAKAAAAESHSTDALKEEIAQAARERDELQSEIASLKAQLSLAQEEVTTTQAKLASVEQAQADKTPGQDAAVDRDATGAPSDGAAALADSAAQLSALNATLLSVQSELSSLHSTHNATLTELQLLNDIVAGQIELESDLDDAAASSSLATEVLKRLESMQAKLTGAAADAGATSPTELHSSAAQLASTVSSLGAEMDQVARENESLRSINAEYESVLELLQGNITALLNREHECITDLEALRLETEEAASRAEAARLAGSGSAETTAAPAVSDADLTELATLREAKASLAVEHASVLAELDRVQSQLEEQAAHIPTDEIGVAAEPVADSESASASLALCSTQLSACNASASALEGDMSSLEGALDKLQQQYAQAQEELHEAKREAATAAAKAKMDETVSQATPCPICPAPVPAAAPLCPSCPVCRRPPAVCVTASSDAAVSVVSLPVDFDESGLIDLDIHDESNDGSSSLVAECTSETDSYFYFEQFHQRECSRFIHSTSDRLEHIKGLAELQGIGGAGWKDFPETADAQRDGSASPAADAHRADAAATDEAVRRLTAENSRLQVELEEATAARALLSCDDASGTATKLVELTSANAALQRDLDEAAVIVAAAANNTRSHTSCQASLREAHKTINETRKEMQSLEAQLHDAHTGAHAGAAAATAGGLAASLEARLSAAEKDTRALRVDMIAAISETEASIAASGSGLRRVAAANSIPRSVADWLDFGAQVGAALRSFDLHELSYLSAAQRIVATFIYVIADLILFQLLLPRTRLWIGLMVLVWAALSVLAALHSVWIGLVLAAANTVLALLMCCKPSAALFAVGVSMGRGGRATKSDEADSLDAQPTRRNGVHTATLPPPAMHAAAVMPPALASVPPPMRPALHAAAATAAPQPAHVSPQQLPPPSRVMPMPAAGAPSVHSPPLPRQLAPAAPQPELLSPTRAPMSLPSQLPPPVHPLPPSSMLPALQPQHIPFLPPESPPESQQPHAQLPQRPPQHISPPPAGLPSHPQAYHAAPHAGSRRGSTGLPDASSLLTPIPAFSPAGPADQFSHTHSDGPSQPNSAGADAVQVGSAVDFPSQPQQQAHAGYPEYPAELSQEEQQQQQQQMYDAQQQDNQQHFEYQQQQQQHTADASSWPPPDAALPLAAPSVAVSGSPGLFGPDGGEFAAAMTQPMEYQHDEAQGQGLEQQTSHQTGSAHSSHPNSATVSPQHAHRPLAQYDEMSYDLSHHAMTQHAAGAEDTGADHGRPMHTAHTQPHEPYREAQQQQQTAQQPSHAESATSAAPPASFAAAATNTLHVPVSAAVPSDSAVPLSALERRKLARKNFGGFAAAAAAAAAASSSMPTYSDLPPSSFPAQAPAAAPLSPATMPPPRPSYGMPPPPAQAASSRPPMPGAATVAASESAMDGTAMPPMRPGYAAAAGFGATTTAGRFPMPPAFPQ